MVYLLPGMGANRKMYGAWNQSSSYRFLDWPEFNGESSLRAVAEKIIENYDIGPDDIVGGSSLGGIVAIEIDEILNNSKVVLLGSAIDVTEVNSFLLKLSVLSDYAPIKVIQLLTGKYDVTLLKMFSESDPQFIKMMCQLIPTWKGYLGNPKKLLRIHGAKDLVISCPNEAHKILDGGHLIAMTHASNCEALLSSCL